MSGTRGILELININLILNLNNLYRQKRSNNKLKLTRTGERWQIINKSICNENEANGEWNK